MSMTDLEGMMRAVWDGVGRFMSTEVIRIGASSYTLWQVWTVFVVMGLAVRLLGIFTGGAADD